MLLEYNLRFDGRSEVFVPEEIKLSGQIYQMGNEKTDKKVLEDIAREKENAIRKLNQAFSPTNISLRECSKHLHQWRNGNSYIKWSSGW